MFDSVAIECCKTLFKASLHVRRQQSDFAFTEKFALLQKRQNCLLLRHLVVNFIN
jgi:hypothetical protein